MDEKEKNYSAFFGGEQMRLSDGTTRKVAALPVRKFPELSEALDDEPALVALFLDAAPEEVDSMPVEDFEAVLQKGKEINYPPFSRWTQRQRETARFLASMSAADPTPAGTSGGNGANM